VCFKGVFLLALSDKKEAFPTRDRENLRGDFAKGPSRLHLERRRFFLTLRAAVYYSLPSPANLCMCAAFKRKAGLGDESRHLRGPTYRKVSTDASPEATATISKGDKG
jgi:hypothetical protein